MFFVCCVWLIFKLSGQERKKIKAYLLWYHLNTIMNIFYECSCIHVTSPLNPTAQKRIKEKKTVKPWSRHSELKGFDYREGNTLKHVSSRNHLHNTWLNIVVVYISMHIGSFLQTVIFFFLSSKHMFNVYFFFFFFHICFRWWSRLRTITAVIQN